MNERRDELAEGTKWEWRYFDQVESDPLRAKVSLPMFGCCVLLDDELLPGLELHTLLIQNHQTIDIYKSETLSVLQVRCLLTTQCLAQHSSMVRILKCSSR